MTARRLLLLLVAAVLMSLGFALDDGSAQAEPDTETVALAQSVVNGVPPMREIGRLAADPGLVKVQAHTEVFAAEPILVPLGMQDEEVPLVSRAAALPVADDRAPPVRQVVV